MSLRGTVLALLPAVGTRRAWKVTRFGRSHLRWLGHCSCWYRLLYNADAAEYVEVGGRHGQVLEDGRFDLWRLKSGSELSLWLVERVEE